MHLITLLLLGAPLLQLLAGSENTAGQKRKAPSGCGLSSIDDSESRTEIARSMLELKTFRSENSIYTTCNEANKKTSSSINFIDAENSDVPSSLDVHSDYLDEDIVGSEEISSGEEYSSSEVEDYRGDGSSSSGEEEILDQGGPNGSSPIKKVRFTVPGDSYAKLAASENEANQVFAKTDVDKVESWYRNAKIEDFIFALKGHDGNLVSYYIIRSLNERKYVHFSSLLKNFSNVPVSVEPVAMAIQKLQDKATMLIKPLSALIEYRPKKFVDVVNFIITSPDSTGLKVSDTLKRTRFDSSVYAAILERALEIKSERLIIQLDSANLLKITTQKIFAYFLVLYELKMYDRISKLVRYELYKREKQYERKMFIKNLILQKKFDVLLWVVTSQPFELLEFDYEQICQYVIPKDNCEAFKSLLPNLLALSKSGWESKFEKLLALATHHGALECLKEIFEIGVRNLDIYQRFDRRKLVLVDKIAVGKGYIAISNEIRKELDGGRFYVDDDVLFDTAFVKENASLIRHLVESKRVDLSRLDAPKANSKEDVFARANRYHTLYAHLVASGASQYMLVNDGGVSMRFEDWVRKHHILLLDEYLKRVAVPESTSEDGTRPAIDSSPSEDMEVDADV